MGARFKSGTQYRDLQGRLFFLVSEVGQKQCDSVVTDGFPRFDALAPRLVGGIQSVFAPDESLASTCDLIRIDTAAAPWAELAPGKRL